nr:MULTISPECIES: VOC family protein [Pseudomonas]
MMVQQSCVIPCIRYRDAPAALDWLCENFGFTRHLVVSDRHGGIAHAQLTLGNSMLMLGSMVDSEYGRLMRSPEQAGGCTQSLYLLVDDADVLYRRAVAAGAEIVIDIKDEGYGGRGFTCRDPEGHVWSFGTYDPWAR